MKHQVVSVTEFKAKCLALLDQVSRGGTITVTKRGQPLATVRPPSRAPRKTPEGLWAGKVLLSDDFLAAMDKLSDMWDVAQTGPGARG